MVVPNKPMGFPTKNDHFGVWNGGSDLNWGGWLATHKATQRPPPPNNLTPENVTCLQKPRDHFIWKMGLDSNLPVAWIFQRKSGVRTNSELFVRFRRKKKKKISCRFLDLPGEIPGWLVQSCCLESSHPCTHWSFMCRGGLGWKGKVRDGGGRMDPWDHGDDLYI